MHQRARAVRGPHKLEILGVVDGTQGQRVRVDDSADAAARAAIGKEWRRPGHVRMHAPWGTSHSRLEGRHGVEAAEHQREVLAAETLALEALPRRRRHAAVSGGVGGRC